MRIIKTARSLDEINQGVRDSFRLQSCEAIWNGEDLELIYEEPEEPTMIG